MEAHCQLRGETEGRREEGREKEEGREGGETCDKYSIQYLTFHLTPASQCSYSEKLAFLHKLTILISQNMSTNTALIKGIKDLFPHRH